MLYKWATLRLSSSCISMLWRFLLLLLLLFFHYEAQEDAQISKWSPSDSGWSRLQFGELPSGDSFMCLQTMLYSESSNALILITGMHGKQDRASIITLLHLWTLCASCLLAHGPLRWGGRKQGQSWGARTSRNPARPRCHHTITKSLGGIQTGSGELQRSPLTGMSSHPRGLWNWKAELSLLIWKRLMLGVHALTRTLQYIKT